MKDSDADREQRAQSADGIITMPSGLVYLGQFIDHDLTRDLSSLEEATPNVEANGNRRTPKLDLDHLYGKDAKDRSGVACIYENDGMHLRLGLTNPAPDSNGTMLQATTDDLYRVPKGHPGEGNAVVIDPRSDENLVIAQLHVLFIKFHNQALDWFDKGWIPDPEIYGSTLFERARRFVTWHYQWIILNEFLPSVVRIAVLEKVGVGQFKLYDRPYTPQDYPVAIPVEFSVAAFRFGHSMIQENYFLNDHIGIRPSAEIITMTKRGGGVVDKLPANYVIGWDHFFRGLLGQLNSGEMIDTFITETLYDLPEQTGQSFRQQTGSVFTAAIAARTNNTFVPLMRPPLPELTLKRGSKVRLPSGQEFVRHFNLKRTFPERRMAARHHDEDFFEANELDERTPLWYYLLREAAEEPNPEVAEPPNLPLQKLGTTGSYIVAEVIYQVLNADAGSIMVTGRGWAPPTLTHSPMDGGAIDSMVRLVQFAQNSY